MYNLKIVLNGVDTPLGAQLPDKISSCFITFERLFPVPIQVSQEQAAKIKAWLRTLIQNLDTDFISYNNILISTTNLKESL